MDDKSTHRIVFKCRFYYYSGVVRPTDQETRAIEKTVCYNSQEEEACYTTQGHEGKHQDWSGRRRSEGKMWLRAFILVSVGKGIQGDKARQGAQRELANLNNFSWLWGIGAVLVVWYLALG